MAYTTPTLTLVGAAQNLVLQGVSSGDPQRCYFAEDLVQDTSDKIVLW
jgi:hypothetical protein